MLHDLCQVISGNHGNLELLTANLNLIAEKAGNDTFLLLWS